MRTLHSFATICVFGAALAALLPACSSDDPGPSGSAGAPGTAGASAVAGASGSAAGATGNAANGAAEYNKQCTACHAADGQGNQGPNITKSVTAGIGTWTYQQFHDAVRLAKNKDGTDLCAFMSKFEVKDLSEAGILDIYAFLQSKPAVDTPQRGSYCP